MPEPGAAPGTLRPPAGAEPVTLRRIVYDAESLDESEVPLEQLDRALAPVAGKQVWLDVRGLGDGEPIRHIGEKLGLHLLTIEDVVHVHQRPKLEAFDSHLYLVLRMVRALGGGAVDDEQLSLVLAEGLLVTFQERPGDCLEPVRQRLRQGRGRLRARGIDSLAVALIDAVVDEYHPVVEAYADTMDELEEAVWSGSGSETQRALHGLRRELRALRRAIQPLRDVLARLERGGAERIGAEVAPALRDCHDHVLQALDVVESARERATELAAVHLSLTGERTNEVMKVLTIIATIFIPLTFLCGLYGMNFDPEVSPYNMPELKWRYGYPAFWLLSLAVLAGLLLFFRHKGWLGRRR